MRRSSSFWQETKRRASSPLRHYSKSAALVVFQPQLTCSRAHYSSPESRPSATLSGCSVYHSSLCLFPTLPSLSPRRHHMEPGSPSFAASACIQFPQSPFVVCHNYAKSSGSIRQTDGCSLLISPAAFRACYFFCSGK